jgi:hypothetical protein
VCGNVLANTGYPCYLKNMIEEWRAVWSSEAGVVPEQCSTHIHNTAAFVSLHGAHHCSRISAFSSLGVAHLRLGGLYILFHMHHGYDVAPLGMPPNVSEVCCATSLTTAIRLTMRIRFIPQAPPTPCSHSGCTRSRRPRATVAMGLSVTRRRSTLGFSPRRSCKTRALKRSLVCSRVPSVMRNQTKLFFFFVLVRSSHAHAQTRCLCTITLHEGIVFQICTCSLVFQ